MMKFKVLIFSTAALTLAACGGGGGGTTSAGIRGSGYNELAYGLADFAGKVDSGRGSYVETEARMPTSGTATYNGVGGVDIGDDDREGPQLLGKSRITANFGTRKISGQMTDFKAERGSSTSGGRLLVNGDIRGSRISGRTTGTVNLQNKTNGNMNYYIDAPAEGAFAGKDAIGAEAVIIVSEGITKSGTDAYSVIFSGEK